MPLRRREGGVKSDPRTRKKSTYEDEDEDEDEPDSGFSDLSGNEDVNDNNRIYYILLRAHSGIPYINTRNVKERVDTVTVPRDMNFYKITSAINGEINCGKYNYNEKKRDILTTVAKDELNPYTPKNIKDRLLQITKNIQKTLREKEKGLFEKSQERSSISNTTFLNKTFHKYSNEFTIQVLYIDEDDVNSKQKDVLNYFTTYDDIYDSVIDYCGFEIDIDEDNGTKKVDVFDLKGLIDYLYNNPKFNTRNCVLMDFSCSSLPNNKSDDDLIQYLNEKNLHGGKYKLKSNINKKKTKKYRNVNNRKTKNRKSKK